MPNKYLGYPFVVDAREMMQNAFNYLKLKIPGWQPSEGQLDVWLIEATAGEAADIGTLVSQVPKALFRYLGTLYGIPPVGAASAITTSTWFLTDDLGHTIPAGTQVSIADASGTPRPFTVLIDVIVPGGETETTAGQVVLIATYPGIASSGIGSPAGVVNLLDTLAWVDHITMVDETTDGADAETDDEYLDRLSSELRLITPRPILHPDFAILARKIPGIQRAVAIDGYNPIDGTYNNERMVTLVGLDDLGAGISAPLKSELEDYLDAMREINFVVHTTDPAITDVDVTVHFTVSSGYAVEDVEEAVTDAIEHYLDPVFWGVAPDGDNPAAPTTWTNDPSIRIFEVATIINNTNGVRHITLLTVGVNGGSQDDVDVALAGIVPLPNPGIIVVNGT